ncbi:MAG: NAD(P)H-dependent oxidoreductase [Sneathiella sp.]
MTHLLYITGSPRSEGSHSLKISDAYVHQRIKDDPALDVIRLDLWDGRLPEFDGDKAAAKMTFFGMGNMDKDLQSAWDEITAITEQFTQADEYVFSVPMWNGGIPYKLKQYIDIITQPGLLFGFTPEDGYSGLLKNKRATACYTSGVYAPGSAAKYGPDFQSTYLDWWFDLVGIEDVSALRFQPTLMTTDAISDQAKAEEKARDLATSHAR